MRKEWKDFVDQIGMPVRFLHRKELTQLGNVPDGNLPMILLSENDQLSILVPASVINRCGSLDELIHTVRDAVREYRGRSTSV